MGYAKKSSGVAPINPSGRFQTKFMTPYPTKKFFELNLKPISMMISLR
jgi:hypothetical protein